VLVTVVSVVVVPADSVMLNGYWPPVSAAATTTVTAIHATIQTKLVYDVGIVVISTDGINLVASLPTKGAH
jgi:hypothetical protein